MLQASETVSLVLAIYSGARLLLPSEWIAFVCTRASDSFVRKKTTESTKRADLLNAGYGNQAFLRTLSNCTGTLSVEY